MKTSGAFIYKIFFYFSGVHSFMLISTTVKLLYSAVWPARSPSPLCLDNNRLYVYAVYTKRITIVISFRFLLV